jgi:hypothetical protein
MSSVSASRRQAPSWGATRQEQAELQSMGFTPEQIRRLIELRSEYPLIEEVFSRAELQRLLFLKWLHERWTENDELRLMDA